MLHHPTLDQLKQLRLQGMADAFADMLGKAEADQLAHGDWLALLLDREVAERNHRRLQYRLRNARLRHSQASIEDVDYRTPRHLDRSLFQQLATGQWIADKHNYVAGILAIADTIKPDAAAAVAEMKANGIAPVMLTGDNRRTAEAVAAEVGIEEIHAQVLPQDKAARLRAIQSQDGARVVMAGDGINDAPALMQANIGIAIGAGTDIAIESSDIIVMGDRVGAIMEARAIGALSYRKTLQNLWLAFLFNGVGVPLATTGLVLPSWAMSRHGGERQRRPGQLLRRAAVRAAPGAIPTASDRSDA